MKINDILIRYLVQPTLLLAAFAVACVYGATSMTAALVLLLSQITLGALEHYYPKRADWQISWRNKGRDLLSFMLYSMAAVLVIQCYETYLGAWFTQLRQSVGMDWWPQHWPVWARIFLALSLSELVWYIFHRLEHRFYPIWRFSGHGMHHSFKYLNAINFNTNHPVEALWISMPSIIVAFLFGAGSDAQAAVLLIIVNTSCAHANVGFNSKIIGWLFTTNSYHFRHHSIVLHESNTNYGCALIIWDRLFGTFEEGEPKEAGIGKRALSFREKLLMPFREPAGVDIAPIEHHAR